MNILQWLKTIIIIKFKRVHIKAKIASTSQWDGTFRSIFLASTFLSNIEDSRIFLNKLKSEIATRNRS